jgi:hypothetical protein
MPLAVIADESLPAAGAAGEESTVPRHDRHAFVVTQSAPRNMNGFIARARQESA